MDLLTPQQVERYSRQLILRDIGGKGQMRLLASRALLVGMGGLGAPAALYLAAAGVGHLVLVDGDRVELSNLGRQIIHTTDRIGQSKVESARDAIHALNPEIRITMVDGWADGDTLAELLKNCDIVLDGCDNFETRQLVNEACHRMGKPLVSGAVLGFEGQLATFRSGVDSRAPCYRCLYPTLPEAGLTPTCATAGVLSPLVGMVGSMQAVEAIKELLGIGESLAGWLLLIQALDGIFYRTRVSKDPACPVCGERQNGMGMPVS